MKTVTIYYSQNLYRMHTNKDSKWRNFAGSEFLPPRRQQQEGALGGDSANGNNNDIKEQMQDRQDNMIANPNDTYMQLPSTGDTKIQFRSSAENDDGRTVPTHAINSTSFDEAETEKSRAISWEPKAMNSLISSELNQLGPNGRMTALEDLHGVSHHQEEEPDGDSLTSLVSLLLDEFRRIRERSALDKAMFLAPEYVKDPSFCLMFLRADNFDVQLAARRMVSHFKEKLELFGSELLPRDITFYDLDPEDQAAVLSGSEQYLGIDRSERTILFSTMQSRNYKSIENQLRAIWYLMMLRLRENHTMQQRGVVIVRYNIGGTEGNPFSQQETDRDVEYSRRFCALLPVLPLSVKSFHFCYDGRGKIPTSLTDSQGLIGRNLRVRFRAHNGKNHVDSLQSLQTFGIPQEMLPVENNGKVSNKLFLRYVAEHQEWESIKITAGTTSANSMILPKELDVLIGRGRPYQDFPGNIRLARLIEEYRDDYAAKPKSQKLEITDGIINLVKESGGRFLKKSGRDGNGKWIEAGQYECREKVSRGFRRRLSADGQH